MTETQERFLRAILAQVPLESVVELHLFPAIRRGSLETGVAVVVTELPEAPAPSPVWLEVTGEQPVAVEDPSLESIALGDVDADARERDDAAVDDTACEDGASEEIVAELQVTETVTVVATDGSTDDEAIELLAPADEPPGEEGAWSRDGDEDSPYAAEPEPVSAPVSPRMRISTASYRHTIKGVERGKWSMDLQEEADAPLEAVEAVLRGVRHRSTEPADPELVTREQLAHLVAPAVVAPAA